MMLLIAFVFAFWTVLGFLLVEAEIARLTKRIKDIERYRP